MLSVKHATDGGGESGEKPKNGNYLLIDVQYEATEVAYNYNPYDWTIGDADGRTFEYGTSYYAGDVKELNSGTVAKGSKARGGVIVIDAPKGQLTLEFGGGFGSDLPQQRTGSSAVEGRIDGQRFGMRTLCEPCAPPVGRT